MNGYLMTMITDYPWFGWLLAVAAVAGLAYGSLWVAGLTAFASDWIAYRRAVLGYKTAVRRRLEQAPCAVCELADEGMDPPEYQHPDGDDDLDYCRHGVIRRTCTRCDYDWDGPGDDWSPGLAWGPPPAMPAREMASLADVLKRAHELGLLDDEPVRCSNADCYLYGSMHNGPCDVAPTMPAACYPVMGLADGPAMPPQDWSGHAASLEVLARGDNSPTLTGRVAAELGHDTTEAAVDSMWTRAQAAEVNQALRELER